MELVDLRFFAAVAETGRISKASELLNTVQSNVTTRVKKLEGELGVELFRRHSRGAALTESGRRLLPYVSRIHKMVDEARGALVEDGDVSGSLRIGSMETTAALRMPGLLAAYCERYPEVDLNLQTNTTQNLVEQVLNYNLDGAFVAEPIVHHDLEATPLSSEELVLVSAAKYRRLEDLSLDRGEIKLLLFREGCAYRRRFERFLSDCGYQNIRRHELGTLDGILGCVAADMGITVLPRAVVAGAAQSGGLALHDLPAEVAQVRTLFIHRSDVFKSSAFSRFKDAVAQADL